MNRESASVKNSNLEPDLFFVSLSPPVPPVVPEPEPKAEEPESKEEDEEEPAKTNTTAPPPPPKVSQVKQQYIQ